MFDIKFTIGRALEKMEPCCKAGLKSCMDVGEEGAGARKNADWGKKFHFITLCYRKGEKRHASLRKVGVGSTRYRKFRPSLFSLLSVPHPHP